VHVGIRKEGKRKEGTGKGRRMSEFKDPLDK